jgi:hypothetical protein
MKWFDKQLNERIVDYIYVDEKRVDSYIDQMGGIPPKTKKVSATTTISLSPSIQLKNEADASGHSLTEKVEFLRRTLVIGGKSELQRPISLQAHGEVRRPFVHESCLARKVTFSGEIVREHLGADNFSVWISDPDPKTLNGPGWTFRGSFLYLTETKFDEGGPTSLWSGRSSLQVLANAAQGRPLLEASPGEPMGRGSVEHPIEKLRAIGGVVGDQRSIETIYKVRFMTDEQVFNIEGDEHRVHDILGYPIYIAAL